MKPFPVRVLEACLWSVTLCSSAVLSFGGSQEAPKAPASPKTQVKSEAIPQSIFTMPRARDEGRDPFFPNSIRPYEKLNVVPVVTTNAAPPVNYDLKLKALSGTPEKRLALINNHTFEEGEEAEVVTSNGRVHIKCIAIRSESVVIQIGGERRELRLRANA